MTIGRTFIFLFALLAIIALPGCGEGATNGGEQTPEEMADVKITSELGDIYIKLYDETPRHKANFLKLAKEGFYDGTSWHRVIYDFMIQGGDPNTKEGNTGEAGIGGPDYTLAPEIVPELYHKKGALAAARMPDAINPKWESSGSQFYIVHGKTWTDQELEMIEQQVNGLLDVRARNAFDAKPENKWINDVDLYGLQEENPDSFEIVKKKIDDAYAAHREKYPPLKFTPEQLKTYKTEGGYPPLDRQYTIFGEVVKGLDVVDKVAAQPTGQMDKPRRDIPIKVEVLK